MKRLLSFCLATTMYSGPALRTDIEFANHQGVSLTLDAHVPEGSGPFPTAIVVHGGGFIAGDKQSYVKPLFPLLTEAGFTWFTINYRLSPRYKFPAAVEDVEAAVRWVKQHAAEYKADVKRIALIGESAGGHLVAYAGVTSAKKAGIAAVVPIYAPHDFAARAREFGKIGDTVRQFLGVDDQLTPSNLAILEKASPYAHVKPGLPPFLLLHGTQDALVPYNQSVRMQKRLKEAGVRCDLYTVEGGQHGMGSWEKLTDQGWKKFLADWLKDVLR